MLAHIQVFVCGEACIGSLRRLGVEHAVWSNHSTWQVTGVSYHPSESCMLTSSVDSTVRMWRTWELRHHFLDYAWFFGRGGLSKKHLNPLQAQVQRSCALKPSHKETRCIKLMQLVSMLVYQHLHPFLQSEFFEDATNFAVMSFQKHRIYWSVFLTNITWSSMSYYFRSSVR